MLDIILLLFAQGALQHEYSVFARQISFDFEKAMKPMANFSTIAQFWNLYSHVKRPSDFEKDTCLNVFIKGIQPKWEDPCHEVGGAWTFRARRAHANMIWENLLLGFIGEQFETVNEDTGVLVNASTSEFNKFQVWFRHGRNEEIKAQVRKDFLRIIELSPDTQLSFTGFNVEAANQAADKDSTKQNADGQKGE